MTQKSKTVSIDLDEDVDSIGTVVDEDRPLPLTDATDSDVVDEDSDGPDALPKAAIRNLDGSVSLPLIYPVTIRSRRDGKISEKHYAVLQFYRLTGADLNAINATSDDKKIVMSFARSTRINIAVMSALYDRMDGHDIVESGKVINHFFGAGRKTGQ